LPLEQTILSSLSFGAVRKSKFAQFSKAFFVFRVEVLSSKFNYSSKIFRLQEDLTLYLPRGSFFISAIRPLSSPSVIISYLSQQSDNLEKHSKN
jgi:hypothetical protein